MKLLVINNLQSGLGDGAVYDFIRACTTDGDEFCIRSTDGTVGIEKLLNDARYFDAIIASGGDGTISSVAYALRGTGIPILPFPAGTANLIALNLASPLEPHALATLVRSGRTLDFDIGEIEKDGSFFGFSFIAGAGYDAQIIQGAKPTKRLLGTLAYFSAALSNPTPPRAHFTLTMDGRTIERDGLAVLLINFSKIQFDIAITHDNLPRDGVFDVAVLKAENAFALVPALIQGLLDRTGDHPDRSDAIEVFQAQEIEIVSDPDMELQYDGEATGLTTPFHARVLKRAARFYVSEEGFELFG